MFIKHQFWANVFHPTIEQCKFKGKKKGKKKNVGDSEIILAVSLTHATNFLDL